MSIDLQDIKPFLLEYVNEITEPSKNGGKNQYICPLCGSGTGSHHSGAFTVYPDTSSYHCFACDANGDIFTLYGSLNGLDEKTKEGFRTIADKLKSKYNISFSQPIRQKKQPAKPVETKQEKDYTKFFVMAEQHLHETDYLTQRGISIDTQRKFHCGYVANYQYNQNSQSTPAVIIPTSDTSFMWRSTTENIKQKRGTTHVLNPSALNAPYCFVVEGEIDCMSVDECGFACVGLGSTSNIRKIFEYDTSKTVLIIAMDNDPPEHPTGQETAVKLAKLCDEYRVPYIVASKDIWSDCKDANELLVKERTKLVTNLQKHSERAVTLDKDKWQSEHAQTISETSRKMHTLDDTGNAQRMYDLCGDVMRYCYTDRRWLCYQDGRWNYDTKGGVFVWADKVLESMKSELSAWAEHEGGAMFEDYKKHMKKTRSNNSKRAMVKEMEHLVAVSPAELDADRTLVNARNGVINLNDFTVSEHKSDFLMTRMLGTSIPENPKKPEKWLAFLDQIFSSDKELIRYIQKALGYSLSGDTSEQCAFFLYGTGRNGKSTFLEVVRKIMGDYATNIQPESIMVKASTNTANSDIARLKGARLVTSVEPNEGMRLNEGLIKQLTGDDMITARKLYGDEFEFRPEFKLWMATNHKPTIRGTDLGIWRRIHIIPFSVTIPEQAVDRKLPHKLEEELPDILAWTVEGYKLWKMEGLRKPKVIEDAVEEYRNEMDVISAFLASDYVVQGSEVKAQALYAVYCQWCSESNEYKMSSTKFGREIAKRYNKVHKMTGWYYNGISLDNISIG